MTNSGKPISTSRAFRLAILASHVIQYQGPLFRRIAADPDIDLTVFFCSDFGLRKYHDTGFGGDVRWDVPLLQGYRYEFLPRLRSDAPSDFFGTLNPTISSRLWRGHFDALLVHGWWKATNWQAMLTAFAAGIPVIMRGESNLMSGAPRRKGLRAKVLQELFRRVTAFLAIGTYNAEFYRKLGVAEEKIVLAPYAVDNGLFYQQAASCTAPKHELKRRLGIDPDSPMILYSGKLIDQKRPTDLLKAFHILHQRRRCSLVFLGDGELRAELQAYISDNGISDVYITGFQNQSRLGPYFCAADVFVLPSKHETWGLVVNEAMCFGLPVIVSDRVGSGGDLIREGGNGYIFPAYDIEALVDRLERILADDCRRVTMGRMSKQIIATWSYEEDLTALKAVLTGLAAPTSPYVKARPGNPAVQTGSRGKA